MENNAEKPQAHSESHAPTASHTPGPWRVDYLDKNSQRVVSGEHIEICSCWHHSVGAIEMEMEANARLIAAAPDMLKALKEITNASCGDECVEIAWAAIQKAEGK